MEMSRNILFGMFAALAIVHLVHAQDQSGFISIDCGTSMNSSYTDKTTGINYISDATFVQTGVSKSISSEYRVGAPQQQFWYVTSFPEGVRNCYILKPPQAKGNKYLIRASFMYGDYDGLNTAPVFDLHIGTNLWNSVKISNASTVVIKELVHTPSRSSIYVCLVNTGSGTPFLSALELRPLRNASYKSDSASLALYRRLDVGAATNGSVRYGDDALDRIWMPFKFVDRKQISTVSKVDDGIQNSYQLPSVVMETAMMTTNASSAFSFHIIPENPHARYHVFMHFAELEKLQPNQSRELIIYQNDLYLNGPFTPDYLYSTTIFTTTPVSGTRIDYAIYKTESATLPPFLNALEVYIMVDESESQTDKQDMNALLNIKSLFGVRKNWQGDPCAPRTLLWDGLNCSYGTHDPYRITTLNLSSSGLSGEIASFISDLTLIEYLDLSNNSLTGPLPGFLIQMPSLKVLDLKDNNLTGSVPSELIQRSNNGSLLLSVGGNSKLCTLDSCQKEEKKKSSTVPVVASIVSVLALILLSAAIVWGVKYQKKASKANNPFGRLGSLESKKQQFMYSEILSITNNLERELGRGGFGTVYYGCLNNNDEVAVKVLKSSTAEGYKEFHTEVKFLLRVHHVNLTNLVGYCMEATKLVLVYEYMANGNLQSLLSDKKAHVLSWLDRMQIAVDAAQGLEYLHDGCKPPIVHRDVKSANILLNETFKAKMADFGLSRSYPTEGGTHVSTVVAGTHGYLDPEFFQSGWLTKKSDVYSYGSVLLEIVTGRPVIVMREERTHISQWVSWMLENGDINRVVDQRLQGDFEISSAWKTVEIAISCLSQSSDRRPTMSQVVIELKDCLALEMARQRNRNGPEMRNSNVMSSRNLDDADMYPLAR